MELIEINGRSWKKYKGDEGQDVYVAQFVEPQEKILGQFANEESYDILVDGDTDFYLPSGNAMFNDTPVEDESNVAFKFRKNVFTQEEQDGAFEGLFDAAIESNNRGMAAGPRGETQKSRDWVTGFQQDVLAWYEQNQPLDLEGGDMLENFAKKHEKAEDEIRGGVWLRTKVEPEFGTYKEFFPKMMDKLASMSIEEASAYAKNVRKGMISSTNYASAIWSGIAGFYGRYPRIPYGRPTAYTDHHREKFEKCYPFARRLDKVFRELLPNRYGNQKGFADQLDNKFLIGEDTTFTTITVNTTTSERNARMACHRDAGSLNEGFSNLTVISDGKKDWKGGYLVTPEVRAAINVRPGDLLLVDNMRIIHGNTPIEAPDSGVEDLLRMSLVFYFREDMMKLGSWDYEHLRRAYVDDRRKNESHNLWRPYWNGVSPHMWDEEEWFEYLTQHGGEDMLRLYHPKAVAMKEEMSLEDFFV